MKDVMEPLLGRWAVPILKFIQLVSVRCVCASVCVLVCVNAYFLVLGVYYVGSTYTLVG